MITFQYYLIPLIKYIKLVFFAIISLAKLNIHKNIFQFQFIIFIMNFFQCYCRTNSKFYG